MASSAPTKVGPSPVFHGVVWVGLPLLGALAGGLLAWGLDWALGLPWVPMQGPLELVDEVTGDWTLWVLLALGVLLGLALAASAEHDVARITVDATEVRAVQEGEEQRVAAGDVDAVFVDEGLLVLQDAAGRRRALVRLEDLAEEQVREAFVGHGYAWSESDPYADEFSRWVPDAPALPTGANAVLVARQKALEANQGKDGEELRLELEKLGVVVRDRGDRQYWRAVTPGR